AVRIPGGVVTASAIGPVRAAIGAGITALVTAIAGVVAVILLQLPDRRALGLETHAVMADKSPVAINRALLVIAIGKRLGGGSPRQSQGREDNRDQGCPFGEVSHGAARYRHLLSKCSAYTGQNRLRCIRKDRISRSARCCGSTDFGRNFSHPNTLLRGFRPYPCSS